MLGSGKNVFQQLQYYFEKGKNKQESYVERKMRTQGQNKVSKSKARWF